MIPLDEEMYLLDPLAWFNQFSDEEHFKEWCRDRLILELMDMIKVCEKREFYEIALLCQLVIDEKTDFMLSGICDN